MRTFTLWTSSGLTDKQVCTTIEAKTEKQARIKIRKLNQFCDGDDNGNIHTLREMILSLDETEHAFDLGCDSRVAYKKAFNEYVVYNCMGGRVFQGSYSECAERIVIS